MNVRRGGLGRGLGALIPTGPVEGEVAGARFDELPIDSVEPNPRQPREVFDPEAMAELVASIREVGVLQPVVVREAEPGRYQLIMGERRWRASREAGMPTIPAIIRDTTDDHLLRDALLENLHRQQLNPLEEAAAYQQLLQEFGATHDQLADRIGRSRSQVSNMIRLLALPAAVQRRVAAGVISAGHARALLALPDAEAQDRLASRIVAEGLSVRATEELVATRDAGGTERPPRRRRTGAPALTGLAGALSDLLDTRVSVELGRSRGKLTVQFATVDDLERIIAILAPQLSGRASRDVGQDRTPDTPDSVPDIQDPYHSTEQNPRSDTPNVARDDSDLRPSGAGWPTTVPDVEPFWRNGRAGDPEDPDQRPADEPAEPDGSPAQWDAATPGDEVGEVSDEQPTDVAETGAPAWSGNGDGEPG